MVPNFCKEKSLLNGNRARGAYEGNVKQLLDWVAEGNQKKMIGLLILFLWAKFLSLFIGLPQI